MSHNNSTVA